MVHDDSISNAHLGGKRTPRIDKIRKHLLREGRLDKPELIDLLKEAIKVFRKYYKAILNFCY